MPLRSVPDSDLQYYLLAFDKKGNEQGDPDAGGGKLSSEILSALEDGSVTDVFILSHGWKGDLPAAVDQYDRWIHAMGSCTRDRERARERWADFKSIIVGFHWPSLPWGDEKNDGSFATTTGGGAGAFVDSWADRIADTPASRDALRVIYDAALEEIEPDRLSNEVVQAYRTLEREADLAADGVGGAPDADREQLDPQMSYQEATIDDTSFGGGIGDGLLSPLRQLSFWTMKKRARLVGEGGGHDLLRAMRKASPNVRLHLMGHSFGCIVVSSMIHGHDGVVDVPVSSAILIQGAMSHWSYCDDIPEKRGTPGYFRKIIDHNVIAGPVLVTTSKFDSAVGTWYPRAAAPARQVALDGISKLPKYGAIGTFGIRGPGLALHDVDIVADMNHQYRFAPGNIYNLRCDSVVKNGGGMSGAHNDIAHAEVGHAFWDAVLAVP